MSDVSVRDTPEEPEFGTYNEQTPFLKGTGCFFGRLPPWQDSHLYAKINKIVAVSIQWQWIALMYTYKYDNISSTFLWSNMMKEMV